MHNRSGRFCPHVRVGHRHTPRAPRALILEAPVALLPGFFMPLILTWSRVVPVPVPVPMTPTHLWQHLLFIDMASVYRLEFCCVLLLALLVFVVCLWARHGCWLLEGLHRPGLA